MSYNDIMVSLRRRFDEIKDVFPVFEDVRSRRLVAGARSCAIVGCGNGEMELAFIEHCMPALQTLCAVEPDAESVVDLRARIARHLPNVGSTVFQDVAQSWAAGTDQVTDVKNVGKIFNTLKRDKNVYRLPTIGIGVTLVK